MPPTYYAIFTTTGLTRLAEAQASGVPLVFTQLAVGDGNGSGITPDVGMTALVHEVARVSVNDVGIMPSEPTTVRVEGLIPAATGGFTIREAGLFNGAGELIVVASYPPIYKPTPSDGATAEEYIRLLLVYASVESIALSADPAVIMATREYVDAEDNVLSGRITYLEDLETAALAYEQFGDGSDGDAVLDGVNTYPWASLSGDVYTLLRDVYLHDLTISPGCDLLTGSDVPTDTGSWKYFVNGTATVPASATINNDGFNSRSAGSLFGSGTGGAGASGSPNNGTPSDTVTGIIAGGGNGGASSGHTGGAAQAVAARGTKGGVRSLLAMLNGYTLGQDSGTPGVFRIAGGGGGGGGGGESGGAAGDGGNGGGVMCGAIRNLVLDGRISCNGKNGTPATGTISSGGGGGGGGGYLGLLLGKRSGSGLIEAKGGMGGAGVGAGGVAGANGADGVVALINLSEGVTTPTIPHREAGKAIFSGVDHVDITFPNAWAYENATGLDGYDFTRLIPTITSDVYDGVSFWISGKSLTGFTINCSAPVDAEVDWSTEGY